MKNYLKTQNLPWFALGIGILSLFLRICLLNTENEDGFLARNHISGILVVVITVAVAVVIFIATRSLQQANRYQFNFPPSIPGALGTLVGALGIGSTSVVELVIAGDALTAIAAILGLMSVVSLIFLADCRWKGLHPSPLFHVVICAYLMLRLLCMWRRWGSDPQLQDFCYQLLATVCLMLSAYHRATFSANFGSRASYAFFCLMSIYFCVLSLAGWTRPVFFFSTGIWQLTDLCSLVPMPKDHRESMLRREKTK